MGIEGGGLILIPDKKEGSILGRGCVYTHSAQRDAKMRVAVAVAVARHQICEAECLLLSVR
jgi:hypothetical protein